MNLRELEIGKTAVVSVVGGDGALRQHFLDMGIIPGVEVTIVKYAPRGDPMEIRIHGYELTLRLADAEKIEVVPVDEYETPSKNDVKNRLFSSVAHEENEGTALPDDVKLTFALMGNQNCGNNAF